MKNKKLLVIALLMGLGSALFVSTPFGRIAMFDLASFVLAPLCFLYAKQSFSQAERKILLASLLWFIGACYSNWWRGEDFSIALKGDAIVFNAVVMLVVSITMLKQSHHVFLWFCVGSAISWLVSLYYFQNGALLVFAENAGYTGAGGAQDFLQEKQVYPIYVNVIFMSILFPLRSIGIIPWSVVFAGCISSAFLLLFYGGSRSSFGSMFVMALFVAGFAYQRPLIRRIFKNFMLFFLIGVLSIVATYNVYSYLAQQGILGEGEFNKYVTGREISKAGALGDRDDLFRAWPFIKNHPIVGCGSSALDRWGYIEDDILIPSHSALVAAWTQNGIAGLFFWLYSLYFIIDFIRKRMILFGDWFPFLASQMIGAIWNILFSPFGGCRGLICMTVALCVVSCSPKVMEKVASDLMRKKKV